MTPTKKLRDPEEVTFSVIIGTYNGGSVLGTALDALAAQISEFSYEILVINDASTDSTAEVAKRTGVRLINLEHNQGHGHTLNVGLAEARGRYMAMMDDDCVPPPDWIQHLGLAWSSVGADVTMIGGIVKPFQTDTFNRRFAAYRRPLSHQENDITEGSGFWSRLWSQLSPPVRSGTRPVYYTVGANMSVRVDAARDAGGFTEERGAGEEESLSRPLRAKFGPSTVQLFPEIVMHHNFGASLRDTFRRSRSYGRSKGRDWVRERDIPSVSPLMPCATLTAAAVAVVSPVSSLVLLALSPYLLYRRWVSWFRTSGSREAFIFPYIQAGEEIANNAGFVEGAWKEFRSRRS